MTYPRTRVDPAVQGADIEFLAQFYLTPILAPTPIATRLPNAKSTQDTINGFLRIEAAGGTRVNLTESDLSVLMHSYGAAKYEQQASEISAVAMSYMESARGITVAGWYVVDVPHVIKPRKLTDPDVSLVRYRSLVTWRVCGQTLAE